MTTKLTMETTTTTKTKLTKTTTATTTTITTTTPYTPYTMVVHELFPTMVRKRLNLLVSLRPDLITPRLSLGTMLLPSNISIFGIQCLTLPSLVSRLSSNNNNNSNNSITYRLIFITLRARLSYPIRAIIRAFSSSKCASRTK